MSVRRQLMDERLESWKEIAGYLKRDVSTVQRWEKREGLPIHRLVHDKLGSVYAFRAELDAWYSSRGPKNVDDDPPTTSVEQTSPRPARIGVILSIAIAAVLALVALSAAARWWTKRPSVTAVDVEVTSSPAAYRAYERGEAASQRSDYAGAAAQYREAVRLDPEFALAYFKLSRMASLIGDQLTALDAQSKVMAYLHKLPPEYRPLARARALNRAGDRSAAIPFLEDALRQDSRNDEALYLLGETYLHSGRDQNSAAAVATLERLRSIGKLTQDHHEELATTYAVMGKINEAHELVADMAARWPESETPASAWLLAFEGNSVEALRKLTTATGDRALARASVLTGELSEVSDDWRTAEVAANVEPGAGVQKLQRLRHRGHFLAYRGAFDAALAAYDGVTATRPPARNEGYDGSVRASAFIASALLMALHHDARWRDAVEGALATQPENPRWIFLAGALAAQSGDRATAGERLAALRRLQASSTYSNRAIYLHALEAEVALASGDGERARSLAERIVSSPDRLLDYEMDTQFASTAFRDLLARAEVALGRNQEAVRVLEGLVASGLERVHLPTVYVRALYTLARLNSQLGRPSEARHYAEQFLRHWGSADWDLSDIREARLLLATKTTH